MSCSRGGCEFSEAGHGEVGICLSGFDGTDTGARRGAIDPYRGEPEGLSWNHVMVDALTYMQHAMRGNPDTA